MKLLIMQSSPILLPRPSQTHIYSSASYSRKPSAYVPLLMLLKILVIIYLFTIIIDNYVLKRKRDKAISL
jgi:hypothetical protein